MNIHIEYRSTPNALRTIGNDSCNVACKAAKSRGRGTWAIDRGTLPVGAGVALDSAALERVLAIQELGAKF